MSKERIQNLLKQLCVNLYEREEVMALTLLSAIAGESIFLLGKPGVAKSLIARKLKYAFKDAKSFEYLMNRFSTPDEIFGPVSISKLKDQDKYERITENYLPKSDIVFLDEIWKASPSIQNTLLTVLNEKVYKNGEKEEKLPLKAIISASNELPEPNQGLGALWDRFILRFIVEGISNKDNFFKMIAEDVDINHDPINLDLKISSEEYKSWQENIKKVVIPKEVFDVILYIKTSIDKQNEKNSKEAEEIYISDRRWKKAIKILKTSAFLNGRSEVDLMDCFLLKHILWDLPEQIEFFEELIATAVKEYGYKEQVNLSEYEKIINDFDEKVKYIMIDENIREKVTKSEIENNNQIYFILKTPLTYDGIEFKYVNGYNIFSDNFRQYLQLISNSNQMITVNEKNKSYISNLRYPNGVILDRNITIEIDSDLLVIDINRTFKLIPEDYKELLNKSCQNYMQQIEQEIEKLNKISKTKVDKNHSFVNENNIEYVEHNLTNLRKQLTNLQHSLNEIKHNYNNPSNKTENFKINIKTKYISEFRKIQNFSGTQTEMFISELIKKGHTEFSDLRNKSKLNYKDIKRIFETVYKD